MRTSRWVGLVIAGAIVALGCFDRDLTEIRPGVSTGVDIHVEQIGVIRVDIVVLVDNSGSMAQEQTALTNRFPELIRELIDPADGDGDTRPDHPPVEDLNIGVVTSDMGTASFRVSTCSNSDIGDNGCFRHDPSPAVTGCSATYPLFLARNEDNAASYSPDQMAQDFTCIATLGTNGCGFEQQFKAMRQALTVNALPGGCNQGFLRPDSLLALIFVTDEEDCSVHPSHPEMFNPDLGDLGHLNIRCFLHPEFVESVEEYRVAFEALRPDNPERLVIGMIVGVPPDAPACIGPGDELEGCDIVPAMTEQIDPANPTQLIPSCNTSMGLAFPPRRFVQLARAFGSRAYVDSICKTDWSDAISGITEKLVERLPSTCFPRDLDFDMTDDGDTARPDLCMANCMVIETLSDDRPCPDDPTCPAATCPPATADDVNSLPPCDGGCEPLKRDLGLVTTEGGVVRRQCLLRQATRNWDGSRCTLPPTRIGWYYMPRQWSEADPPCPQVIFADAGTGSLIDVGSSADLRCLSLLCRPERQCGPTSGAPGTDPTIPCCEEGFVCDNQGARLNPGNCIPAE